MATLEFIPGTCLPPVAREEIYRFERSFSTSRQTESRLPNEYVELVLRCHGGVPVQRCFRTPRGKERVVGRFLNFFDKATVPAPKVPSWRVIGWDARLDYSVWVLGHAGRSTSQRNGPDLVPIAALDTSGHDANRMAEFDTLCLDYRAGAVPSVVAWSFHASFPGPVTEPVAPGFAEWLSMLREPPRDHPIASEELERLLP